MEYINKAELVELINSRITTTFEASEINYNVAAIIFLLLALVTVFVAVYLDDGNGRIYGVSAIFSAILALVGIGFLM